MKPPLSEAGELSLPPPPISTGRDGPLKYWVLKQLRDVAPRLRRSNVYVCTLRLVKLQYHLCSFMLQLSHVDSICSGVTYIHVEGHEDYFTFTEYPTPFCSVLHTIV